MSEVYFALGLHMHQPPGNLRILTEANEWEAEQIIRCYERAARYAHIFRGSAFFHVGFSGILLEQLTDPRIVDRYRKFVDIPAMLELYRTADNIEIIGMGYYHPIFPLIPREDWAEHLLEGRQIAQHVLGRSPTGFWPSEMAFSMEMVPSLAEVGYEYVVVDHVHVKPLVEAAKPDCFCPYVAEYSGASITVIPRNRDISNAQESGLDPQWFINEVTHKLKDYPSTHPARLVTTWSDGENGGWFRQMDEGSGFFGHFFAPFMEKVQNEETNIRPVRISDFLKKHPAKLEAHVQTGAWNVASTSGYDFSQWAGSGSQKKAIDELWKRSARYWELNAEEKLLPANSASALKQLRRIILDAETSCYLFWGDAWIPRLYDKLREADAILDRFKAS